MIPLNTYPIYFSLHLDFPFKFKAEFNHSPPRMIGPHYYSQRYTGIRFGPIRMGLVWKNPPPDCACKACRVDP